MQQRLKLVWLPLNKGIQLVLYQQRYWPLTAEWGGGLTRSEAIYTTGLVR